MDKIERKIGQVLNELPGEIRPKCPICASSLFFGNGLWACKSCGYHPPESNLAEADR